MGAGALPDAKAAGPAALPDARNAAAADMLAERDEAVDHASRNSDRTTDSVNQAAPDVWLLPLHDYTFTSPFGSRWGNQHTGVDLAQKEGTPATATHDGVIKLARWFGGYGNCVIIDHGDGTETVYGHFSRLAVQEGQRVEAGEVVGYVGNTGHSYGAHLHFEVRIDGTATDPIPFMRKHGVDIRLEVESAYGLPAV